MSQSGACLHDFRGRNMLTDPWERMKTYCIYIDTYTQVQECATEGGLVGSTLHPNLAVAHFHAQPAAASTLRDPAPVTHLLGWRALYVCTKSRV